MFEDLCRLCSKPHCDDETSDIFSTNGISLVFIIKECTNLNVDRNDKLPDKICKQCNENLNVSYAFRRRCEYVDQKFRQELIISDYDNSIKKEYEIPNASYESDNKAIEIVTQLLPIKTEVITDIDDNFCPTQNVEVNSYPDNNSTQNVEVNSYPDYNSTQNVEVNSYPDIILDNNSTKKVTVKVKTMNKVKAKKNSTKNSAKPKFNENNKKKEQNDSDVQIHMCYLCGALVKRIHSHMKAHRDAGKPKLKKYRCEKCGAAFSRLNNLNIHLKTHLDIKPLKCTLCDKRFIIKRYLDRHMIVHTGDRPWKCQFCSKAFQTKYNLNTHVRVHTREKPFKCPFCELCFRQRAALNIHVRTHNSAPNTCT